MTGQSQELIEGAQGAKDSYGGFAPHDSGSVHNTPSFPIHVRRSPRPARPG